MYSSIFFDRTFDKARLKDLISWTFRCYGSERALEFSEYLKNLGFLVARKVGFSLGIEDLLIPKENCWAIRWAEKIIEKRKSL
jgi:hypothetical protein